MKDINTHKVSLKFFDFDYLPDQLTKELGLEPTEIALKGQEYFVGPEFRKIKKTWPWNFWMYQIVIKQNNHSIIDQINSFIDTIITPRQVIIKKINEKCETEFSIVQYFYDRSNPGLHIDNNRLKIISEIGAEIDIDIYVFE